MESILKYFEGEKLQCLIGIAISLTCIAVAGYGLYAQKPFLKGVAYVYLPLAAFLLMICVGVVLRAPRDIERVTGFYQDEPAKLQTEELPRMEGVVRNFSIIKKVELGIVIVGLILTVVFWRNELMLGVAVGLVSLGVVLYLFDYFADARGAVYVEFLRSL